VRDLAALDAKDHRSDHGGVVIYFYGSDDETEIKIGKSKRRPLDRKHDHQRQGSRTVQLHFLAGIRGVDSDEKYIHRYFDAARLEREWFRATEPLVAYVRWLKNQWFVTDDETLHAAQLESVPGESWLPNGDTFAPPPTQLTFGAWSTVQAPEITGDDFYTNAIIIEAARTALEHIDLDPASHPAANRLIKARKIFTFRDNGLLSSWHGRVWCNPPFGQWELWAPKILSEWTSGRIQAMCVLLPTRALTAQCVNPLVAAAQALVIPNRRIPFWGPKATNSPDEGHPILYFGQDAGRFKEAFATLGVVFDRLGQA
jgi:Meiotically up-regulated gene 113/DNA N-6-adenine-methyltransferase (Dam)